MVHWSKPLSQRELRQWIRQTAEIRTNLELFGILWSICRHLAFCFAIYAKNGLQVPHIHKRHYEETMWVWQLLRIVSISQIVWLLSYWELFYSWMFWSLNSHWFFLSELTLYLKGLRLNNSWKSSSRFIRIFGIPPFALHYKICKVMQKITFRRRILQLSSIHFLEWCNIKELCHLHYFTPLGTRATDRVRKGFLDIGTTKISPL